MENKRSSHGYRQFSQAPEVATYSTLEPAPRDTEGLQPVKYAPHVDHTGKSYYHGDPSSRQPFDTSEVSSSEQRRQRKRLLYIGVIAAIIALAIGVGVGVGVGITVGKSSSSESGGEANTKPPSNGGSSPNNGASPSSSGSPSSTSSSVAYGPTSGLAAYSCKNDTQTTSTNNVHYYEDCNAAYLTGSADMYDNSITIENLANPPYTRYTLQDCLDVCDAWNANSANTVECRAMTYYANLTQAYGAGWGGNCFVKNGRPTVITRSSDDIDLPHTVSVYMTCLVNGGCG